MGEFGSDVTEILAVRCVTRVFIWERVSHVSGHGNRTGSAHDSDRSRDGAPIITGDIRGGYIITPHE